MWGEEWIVGDLRKLVSGLCSSLSKSFGDFVLGGDLERGEGYVDRFERLGDELDIGVGWDGGKRWGWFLSFWYV